MLFSRISLSIIITSSISKIKKLSKKRLVYLFARKCTMRVNGSLLGKCVNKNVSLIGTVQKIHPDSMGFDVTTADNVNVTVKLQKPVMQNVNGLVEIHGTCKGPTIISCDYYLVFPYNLISTYDAQIDNEAINLGFRLEDNPWKQD